MLASLENRTMKISLCVVTLNEEENLPRCLRSCADVADEIVVVDSGSSDATGQIALGFGARVIRQQWLGHIGQKNHAVSLAANDWVLLLDADEELSPNLQSELIAFKRAGPPAGVAGGSMPRCVLYEGRWIRHGDWYPDRLVRLFNRAAGRFTGLEPHPYVQLTGSVRPFRGDIFHYSFRDAADHWDRCEKYSRIWVQSQWANGKRAGALAPWTHAAWRWFRGYILRAGFLDSPQGWRIARMNSRETFLKYRLLRQAG